MIIGIRDVVDLDENVDSKGAKTGDDLSNPAKLSPGGDSIEMPFVHIIGLQRIVYTKMHTTYI